MAGIFGGENYRTFKKEMDSIVSKTVHNQLMEIDPNYVHWVEKLAKAEHLEQRQLARREIKKIVDSYNMDLKLEVIPQNREKLIVSCLPMVLMLAAKTLPKCRGTVYMDDLVQAGNLGLILGVDNALKTPVHHEAMNKNKAKLSTYLYFWIRKYMYIEAFRNSMGFSGTISDKEAANKYATVILSKHRDENGDEMQNDLHDVDKEIMKSNDFKDLLVVEDEARKFQDESKKMFSILNPKEKKILFMAYGIDTPNNNIYTLEEIGKALGMPRSNVSRTMKNILWKLQHQVKGMASGYDMINAFCLIQGVDMSKLDDIKDEWKMPEL